ncbi:MAG: cycloartenol synthase [Verrucomicrobiota bacterium]
MKTFLLAAFTLIAALSAAEAQSISDQADGNVSVKLEIERAVAKGVAWLEGSQDAESGSWSDQNLPALTALPVSAIMGDPNISLSDGTPASAEKGYEFILSKVKADGGIYGKGLATYNTSLSMMALMQSGNPDHLPVIAKARRLLVNQQQDFDRRGETDNLFDGGIGYGGSYAHSDLSNTHLALEALYYSKQVLADTEHDETGEFDLDWDAAIDFISRNQNSEETVKTLGVWAALREEDEGGFVYYPGDSKAGTVDVVEAGEKRTALRSYGSMSYAGLLAFIYADLDQDDPRVEAVMEWLSDNYTLEENPGMDAQGLYYYYHTMAKALAITGTDQFETSQGETVDWKQDLALEVMSRQQPDGRWINEGSNRWMEDDPALVTAYSLLTLQHVYRNL